MTKWHAQNPNNSHRAYCNRAGELTVSVTDFAGLIHSSQCERCRKVLAQRAKVAQTNATIDAITAPRSAAPVVTSVSISDDDYLL